MSLRELSEAVERAGAELSDAAGVLARLLPGVDALPGAVPGRLGELAVAMHAQLAAAVAARAREAAAHGARFADTAQVLRLVRAGYADIDAEARRRHREGA
jgi:hypothetical protein